MDDGKQQNVNPAPCDPPPGTPPHRLPLALVALPARTAERLASMWSL